MADDDYLTDVKWTDAGVNVVIGAEAPIIIRMNNDEAVGFYEVLSLRAASSELFNQDGSFSVGDRSYDLTAGQWASILSCLEPWYSQYFDAYIADDLFRDLPPDSTRE